MQPFIYACFLTYVCSSFALFNSHSVLNTRTALETHIKHICNRTVCTNRCVTEHETIGLIHCPNERRMYFAVPVRKDEQDSQVSSSFPVLPFLRTNGSQMCCVFLDDSKPPHDHIMGIHGEFSQVLLVIGSLVYLRLLRISNNSTFYNSAAVELYRKPIVGFTHLFFSHFSVFRLEGVVLSHERRICFIAGVCGCFSNTLQSNQPPQGDARLSFYSME